jgi:hypothetical protein
MNRFCTSNALSPQIKGVARFLMIASFIFLQIN